MTAVFVPAVGQYDNIGDIVLRRPHLAMLRPFGRLHVYLGDYPEGYREGLDLASDDVVYRSFGTWYRALLSSARRETTHYAFKPGEIQLSLPGTKEHVAMVPALVALRRRGGRVVRIGAGARGFAPLPRLALRPSLALTDLAVWRDAATAAYLGGDTMPDLGFATGPETVSSDARPLLTVSLRGDRVVPGADWFSGVSELASALDLEVAVVTQVARDDVRSREIAAALGSTTTALFDGTDHAAHEERLRAIFARSRTIVSDRLHVLITGATEGAAPLAPLITPSAKIDRHFTTAGYPSIAWESAAQSPLELRDTALSRLIEPSPGADLLADARARISAVAHRVGAVLDGPRS